MLVPIDIAVVVVPPLEPATGARRRMEAKRRLFRPPGTVDVTGDAEGERAVAISICRSEPFPALPLAALASQLPLAEVDAEPERSVSSAAAMAAPSAAAAKERDKRRGRCAGTEVEAEIVKGETVAVAPRVGVASHALAAAARRGTQR